MKDLFKKFSKPQPEVEDLDTGYDSEYYAGSYDSRRSTDRRDDRREDDRRDDRRDDRWEEHRDDRWNDRRDERRDDRRDERRDDRYEERDYRAERTDRAERVERRDDYRAPRGLYVEEDSDSYRERVEEKVEPVFTPPPAPEYLYYTPASYSDCREGIVKGLAAGHVVVVRLNDLEATDVLRLFDYMMGAVLALNAEMVRRQSATVVLIPDGVELDEDELELDEEEEDEEYEEYEESEDDDEYDDDEYEGYGEYTEYEEDADEDVE